MLKINLKELIENYDQNLLDNLRGFGKEDEFLKFWVPGTNDYKSFLNLIDALVETEILQVDVKIEKKAINKKLIEDIEIFLLKISEFHKNNEQNNINYIINISQEKYKKFKLIKNNLKKKCFYSKI